MLNDATCFKAVYIVCGYTDLRSGMDRLAALLEAQNRLSHIFPSQSRYALSTGYYEVIIMPPAKRLSMTADSLKICDNPVLAKYGYRKIRFAKHKFVMLYRIQDSTVIVDGMFHEVQDYEGIFSDELHL